MDSDESEKSEHKNIEGYPAQPKKGNAITAQYITDNKKLTSDLSGVDGLMSVPFNGPVSDEIIFANEMPRAVHWSVAWADVMMTMFIIFAALYVFKPITKEQVITRTEVRTEYMEKEKIKEVPWDAGSIQSEEAQTIQEIYDLSRQTMSSASSVELVPDKAVRIILKSDLLFDLGKADIREEAKASLSEVAQVLRQTEYMVNVVGHTDDLPINTQEFPSNWELSTARACKVARFLMKDMNIPEEKLYVTGHAYYQPVKPNTGYTNRAANRRVEVIITKERPYGVVQRGQ